jgi:predicted transcriptional regulator
MRYSVRVTAEILTEAMMRAEIWREETQDELVAIALEIDSALKCGAYTATDDEVAGIDHGLRAADAGRFASRDDVTAVFAKHRPA